MADEQYPFPVYLPKRITESENTEDYDTTVTQNENMLNQNFTNMFNRQFTADGRISTLETLMEKIQKSMEED